MPTIPLRHDPRLSDEVQWFLDSRGIPIPDCPPLILTPEPVDYPGAVFDAARVDLVLNVFGRLRHTQGEWAGRPLKPDPWQVAYILAPVFGWVAPDEHGNYVRVIRKVHVEVPRKSGKLLDVDTLMLTARGWRTMGTLEVGDLVHAPDGTLTGVEHVSDVQTDATYRVRFAAGQELVAGGCHQWWVKDRMRERWLTLTTGEIASTYLTGNRSTHRERRYAVATPEPLERADAILPIDPYVFGVWLGDGASAGARISGIDEEIHAAVATAGYAAGMQQGVTRSYLGLQRPLRKLGVIGQKHIPVQYLTASKDQRLALLQGLMDTDGLIMKGASATRCEFTNTNRQLAEDVLFLARSLGWKATLATGTATLNGRDCGPKYRVSWTAWSDRSPFRLTRKCMRLPDRPDAPTRSMTNYIVDVERIPDRPMRCIQVAHPSHCYLAGEGLVPTHNSTLAGGVAAYLTFADGEPSAQVYAVATGKQQAKYCFDPVKAICQKSPDLSPFVSVTIDKISHGPSHSYFAAVGSVADLLHGANVHGAIIDELHVHKDGKLVEAVETGMGARRQPLMLVITTADDGRQTTVYAQRRERVEQLARGAYVDPSAWGAIWAAEPKDNPFAEATWRKANPGFGISPTRRFMEDAARIAQQSPANLASFLRLHLNIRTKQDTRYLDLNAWDSNEVALPEESLHGRECYGGLDLASTGDLCALAWDFPDRHGGHDVIWRLWAPEAALESLDRRTAGSATTWVQRGWLTLTPGNVTDYDYIKATIATDRLKFRVREIGFDPWNATQLVNDLLAEDAPMVAVRQGFGTLSAPTKELQRLLLDLPPNPSDVEVIAMRQVTDRRYRHALNGAVRWQVDNFAVEMDPAGNVKPSRVKASDKIDAVVAAIMALDRATRHEADRRPLLLGSA